MCWCVLVALLFVVIDVTGKHVAVFDFSYPKAAIEKMKAQAASFILVDHHVSAEKGLKDVSNCYFDMGKSGARLAWEYFHPGTEVPNMILYIEDRDIWKWDLPRSKEFTAGWDLVPQTFDAYDAYLDNSTTAAVQAKGETVLEANKAAIKRLLVKAEKRTLKGWPVAVVNCNEMALTDELGHALVEVPGVKAGVVAYYDMKKRQWAYSLRSVGDVDVSVLAGQMGGGGHKHAAAFRSNNTDVESVFDDGFGSSGSSSSPFKGCSLQ